MIDILDHFQQANNFKPSWSFGGGTALMLTIDHRESHDIDIFLDDAQVLPYLNPETQGYALLQRPDSYQTDGTRALKLAYQDIGEIDFICCSSILDDPFERRDVRGCSVALETPAEIIAKKVYFRGSSFQPRDMFDLAAVTEHYGYDYAVSALRQCGTDRCAAALGVIEVGAYEVAMADRSEAIVIWAFPDWPTWVAYERGWEAGGALADWSSTLLGLGARWRRHLMVDAPLSPLRTGRQPQESDRRPLDEL